MNFYLDNKKTPCNLALLFNKITLINFMKKVILTAAVVAANLVAFAQETTTNEGFMPVKGDKTFEIEAVSPFSAGGASPFSLNNASLRFRYFLSDKMAFRTNFSLDIASESKKLGGGTQSSTNVSQGTSTSVTNTLTEGNASNNTLGFSIMPGLEFHKSVAKRLDVYYGAVLDITLKSKSAMAEISKSGRSGAVGVTEDYFKGTEKVEISGANFDDISNVEINGATSPSASLSGTASGTDKGFFRLGLGGVLGTDFYFMKGAYIGIEVTYGLGINTNSAVTTTFSSDIQPVASTTVNSFNSVVNDSPSSGSFNLVPNTTAAFRLGVKF